MTHSFSVVTNLTFTNNDFIEIIVTFLDGSYLLKNEDLINEIYNDEFLKDLEQGKIVFDTVSYDTVDKCFFKKVSSITDFKLNNFAKEIYAIQYLSQNYRRIDDEKFIIEN